MWNVAKQAIATKRATFVTILLYFFSGAVQIIEK